MESETAHPEGDPEGEAENDDEHGGPDEDVVVAAVPQAIGVQTSSSCRARPHVPCLVHLHAPVRDGLQILKESQDLYLKFSLM